MAAAFTTPSDDPAGTVLHGLGELVAFLPHRLGHRLERDVVVVGHGPHGIAVVARGDVPVPWGTGGRAAADALAGPVLAQHPQTVDVVGFGPREAVALAALVRRRLVTGGVTVRHVVAVRPPGGGCPSRWSALDCSCGAGCADGTWAEVAPGPPASAPDGVCGAPLPGRAELTRRLSPVPAAADRVRAHLMAGDPPTAAAYARALARVLDVRGEAPAVPDLPPEEPAAVLRAWQDIEVRDHAMEWLRPGRRTTPLRPDLSAAFAGAFAQGQLVDVEELRRPAWAAGRTSLLDRLTDLVACAPGEAAAAPAAVLAYLTWTGGGGALAALATERALEADPGYRLALLMRRILDAGLPPPGAAVATGAPPPGPSGC